MLDFLANFIAILLFFFGCKIHGTSLWGWFIVSNATIALRTEEIWVGTCTHFMVPLIFNGPTNVQSVPAGSQLGTPWTNTSGSTRRKGEYVRNYPKEIFMLRKDFLVIMTYIYTTAWVAYIFFSLSLPEQTHQGVPGEGRCFKKNVWVRNYGNFSSIAGEVWWEDVVTGNWFCC